MVKTAASRTFGNVRRGEGRARTGTMFHPELIERAARARHSPDAGRNPANCPALVLNAA